MAHSQPNPVSNDVLARAIAGNERAMATIWKAWNPALLRFLRGRHALEPDDLAQQVWLEVARKLTDFQGDSDAFRRWIFTIAHRRLIDAGRARLRRPPPGKQVDTSVEDETDHVDGLDWAMALLRQLPDQQATAVSLRILAGMDVADVATVMGKRAGAVRALTHRGLRRLEELIEAQETDEAATKRESSDANVTLAPVLSLTPST